MSEGGVESRLRKLTIPLKHLQCKKLMGCPQGDLQSPDSRIRYMFSSIKQNRHYQDVRRKQGEGLEQQRMKGKAGSGVLVVSEK